MSGVRSRSSYIIRYDGIMSEGLREGSRLELGSIGHYKTQSLQDMVTRGEDD